MDLSVFLILIFVTFQFVAEYFGWNQLKVKMTIFIATLILTVPNLIFMVIDWWQTPHSRIALLVLNTFKPILRGETYKLFRWLKTVGTSLSSDEFNHLPILKLNTDIFEFYMTRECFEQSTRECFEQSTREYIRFKVIPEEIDVEEDEMTRSRLSFTKCTGFVSRYESGSLVVHKLRVSKQLLDIWYKLYYDDFISHPSVKSCLVGSPAYYNVNVRTARQLVTRLQRICSTEMPILTQFKQKQEWCYFDAGPTLENLNSELVLIQSEGQWIAVR